MCQKKWRIGDCVFPRILKKNKKNNKRENLKFIQKIESVAYLKRKKRVSTTCLLAHDDIVFQHHLGVHLHSIHVSICPIYLFIIKLIRENIGSFLLSCFVELS